MMAALAGVSAGLAGVGVVQALVASRLVASFVRRPVEAPPVRPPVTVLKPLHGDEPLLEEALTTFCEQHYPEWQIVFGVQDEADRALEVVQRLRVRFRNVDIALVVDPGMHGANRKIGNLINMMRAARHDVLVIADSDVHVRPDYLDRLLSALQKPGVGLVTTLYAGLPARRPVSRDIAAAEPGRPVSCSARTGSPGLAEAMSGTPRPSDPSPVMTQSAGSLALAAKLGATQITHGFLPGAVLARAIGRQDCLGATMCLRRLDLERIGGLQALADHLADDNMLGRHIAALGLRVALAGTVPLTTVPEASFRALFRHELRWARTIRALEPMGFAASVLQYPLAWALLTIALTGGAPWSIGLFLIAWVLRAAAALGVDSALMPLWTEERGSNDNAALAFSCPVWLLPLRDIFSVAVMLASYGGRRVEWRGHGLQADTPPPFAKQTTALRQ